VKHEAPKKAIMAKQRGDPDDALAIWVVSGTKKGLGLWFFVCGLLCLTFPGDVLKRLLTEKAMRAAAGEAMILFMNILGCCLASIGFMAMSVRRFKTVSSAAVSLNSVILIFCGLKNTYFKRVVFQRMGFVDLVFVPLMMVCAGSGFCGVLLDGFWEEEQKKKRERKELVSSLQCMDCHWFGFYLRLGVCLYG